MCVCVCVCVSFKVMQIQMQNSHITELKFHNMYFAMYNVYPCFCVHYTWNYHMWYIIIILIYNMHYIYSYNLPSEIWSKKWALYMAKYNTFRCSSVLSIFILEIVALNLVNTELLMWRGLLSVYLCLLLLLCLFKIFFHL